MNNNVAIPKRINLAHVDHPMRRKLQQKRQARQVAQEEYQSQQMGSYWKLVHGLTSITGEIPQLPPPSPCTDISSIQTQHICAISTDKLSATRERQTDKYDLGILGLPLLIESLIQQSTAIHHRLPMGISMHPLTITILTQGKIVYNMLFRGYMPVQPKPELSLLAIEVIPNEGAHTHEQQKPA